MKDRQRLERDPAVKYLWTAPFWGLVSIFAWLWCKLSDIYKPPKAVPEDLEERFQRRFIAELFRDGMD